MNPNSFVFHSDATRHQYHATLQARDQRKLAAWFALLSGCAVGGLLWALT